MQAYTVLSNLKHNGTRYAPGDAVELDEAEAAGLVASGVVKLPEASAAPAEPKADGFPDHSVDQKSQEQAPAPAPSEQPASQPQAPAAPEAPAASAPLEPSSAAPEKPSDPTSSSKSANPGQPTPEQIDQDMAGV